MHDTDEIALAKQALRVELAAARASRSPAELERARAGVRDAVLARHDSTGWECVAAYVPLRSEPGSVELLAALAARGVRVLVPLTLPDRDLDWAEWTSESVGDPLGVTVIAAARAVLVPASAVAADGTRLGRGGGSYDRALARCASDAVIAALLFDGELVHALPRSAWDRSVTDVVLPSGWVHLEGNTALADTR